MRGQDIVVVARPPSSSTFDLTFLPSTTILFLLRSLIDDPAFFHPLLLSELLSGKADGGMAASVLAGAAWCRSGTERLRRDTRDATLATWQGIVLQLCRHIRYKIRVGRMFLCKFFVSSHSSSASLLGPRPQRLCDRLRSSRSPFLTTLPNRHCELSSTPVPPVQWLSDMSTLSLTSLQLGPIEDQLCAVL